MATSKIRLTNAIVGAMNTEVSKLNDTRQDDPSVVQKRIAEAIADAVILEIKSMTIVIVGNAAQYPLTVTSITIT